jgi:GDPmannose 4,6-dehydratase
MKKAFITGMTGQDGPYLAKLLLEKGYKVYGLCKRYSNPNLENLKFLGIQNDIELVTGDITDDGCMNQLVKTLRPNEFYNLAAQSFVGVSFEQPITTAEINAIGPLNMLEAIRIVSPTTKFYQASTSEMFGKVQEVPQGENTPFYPRSPYGVAKLFAHWATINYRESYGIFAANGILFNHEGELRGLEFVTRKITDAVAKISLGKQEVLELGNLGARRDWGYAKDYVEGMWRILQAPVADSYVLATGRTETVRDFVTMSFKAVGINITFEGENENEIGRDDSGVIRVQVNPKFYRPAEVDLLIGSPQKAEDRLGWKATTTLEELCAIMVKADLTRNK